ncbi:MAG: hypothetical protein SOY58_06365 [Candidatus Onthovivens sp.]|nr:hypothetical protein [Candidatus Onthovivens sp.]
MNEYINYFKNLVNQQKNISYYDEIFLKEKNCIDSYTGDAKNYNAHFEIIKKTILILLVIILSQNHLLEI